MISNKTINIVLFGRTGAGKSYLANMLAGRKHFKVGDQLISETSATLSFVTTLPGYPNLQVKIIDTPGFADNRPDMSTEKFLSETLCFLQNLGEGFHIGIYCISAKTRIDAHDIKEIQMIGTLLGQDVFKHTVIAVTQANRLNNEERREVYGKFSGDLHKILSSFGLNHFGSNKVLFADADQFQERFLVPFTKIIKDAPVYQPQIAKELDPTDPNSIKTFLATPEMQAYMKQHEAMLAEQKKETEKLKVLMEKEAVKCQQLQQESLQAQEKHQKNLDKVNQQLQESKISNKKYEEQYKAYQKEQEEKLGQVNQRLVEQEERNSFYQKRNEDMTKELSDLQTKHQELENTRIGAAQNQQDDGDNDGGVGDVFSQALTQIVGGVVGILGQVVTKALK